jgi:hypothetical protein
VLIGVIWTSSSTFSNFRDPYVQFKSLGHHRACLRTIGVFYSTIYNLTQVTSGVMYHLLYGSRWGWESELTRPYNSPWLILVRSREESISSTRTKASSSVFITYLADRTFVCKEHLLRKCKHNIKCRLNKIKNNAINQIYPKDADRYGLPKNQAIVIHKWHQLDVSICLCFIPEFLIDHLIFVLLTMEGRAIWV